MKKAELLAPAGNFECLKAAISNGADAVYLGGKNFSARAFAGNFDHDELKVAVEYAHLRNVRVFVTLNTLLTEKEFSNAIKEAEYYYNSNVDALLVQDLGLYDFIKRRFPDFELHCSTQMHIHNIAGIQTAKKLGFSRVVIARESDLDFVRQACRQGIEIETFVHGAICVSYSGQCLMSSATKNRSANKGMCAQCCRLKYALKDPNG
ncbi:MAG: U32 family peptidase, partial [Erysipelotrichaceae bacterium]|nr:U32 family peptidase [Erysipelotrichaceae bacterium]